MRQRRNDFSGTNHANRNFNRWRDTQLYVTTGSLARKRQYPSLRPPIPVGRVLAHGALRIAEAVFKLRDGVYQWLFNFWLGKLYIAEKTLEEVIAHWAAYFWERLEVVATVGRQSTTTSRMQLPAPHIHGYLPANV